MKENMAASVQEYLWQWQRQVQVTQPNEVERAIAAWRQERPPRQIGRWRVAGARALVALASRLSPAPGVSDHERAVAGP